MIPDHVRVGEFMSQVSSVSRHGYGRSLDVVSMEVIVFPVPEERTDPSKTFAAGDISLIISWRLSVAI